MKAVAFIFARGDIHAIFRPDDRGGAQIALVSLDAAINRIGSSRASLGAHQNRLVAAAQDLDSYSMNLSAARSRIMDTDYAAETTNLAKAQIIQQA